MLMPVQTSAELQLSLVVLHPLRVVLLAQQGPGLRLDPLLPAEPAQAPAVLPIRHHLTAWEYSLQGQHSSALLSNFWHRHYITRGYWLFLPIPCVGSSLTKIFFLLRMRYISELATFTLHNIPRHILWLTVYQNLGLRVRKSGSPCSLIPIVT